MLCDDRPAPWIAPKAGMPLLADIDSSHATSCGGSISESLHRNHHDDDDDHRDADDDELSLTINIWWLFRGKDYKVKLDPKELEKTGERQFVCFHLLYLAFQPNRPQLYKSKLFPFDTYQWGKWQFMDDFIAFEKKFLLYIVIREAIMYQ